MPTGRAPSRASQRGEVARSAAELDDVEPVDVAEYADVVLAHAEDSPRDLVREPGAARVLVGVLRVRRRPERAVLAT